MRLHRRVCLALGSLPFILAGLPTAVAQDISVRPHSAITQDVRDSSLIRTGVRRTVVVQAVERVKGAVVNIHSERTVASTEGYHLNGSQNRVNGMGTGIIIDPRGYIVTNQHVIDDVNVLRCRLGDGSSYTAQVVARNNDTDLALIKINASRPLPVMPLGTAADLMVGETVIAIGNAFGYEHTVSVGVISALKRDVSLNKDMSYKALIQTDASINPGNSGGPLVNINGELVGVNVAIRAGAQGIGFAIPVDNMIRSVGEMFRYHRQTQTYDGMLSRDRMDPAGDGLSRSVVLERIESNSPASAAGLQSGDTVLQVGDVHVNCTFDIERGFLEHKSGEAVPIVVRRQDKEQKVDLVLANPDRMIRPVASTDIVWTKLGLQVNVLPADQVNRLNKQLHGGLEVTAVNTEGPAAKAGIHKGDILVGLHNWETINLDNITYVLNHPDLATFNPLSFYILRAGQVRRGFFQQVAN